MNVVILRIIKAAIACLLAYTLASFDFFWIESLFYDARFRSTPSTPASKNIVLVKILPRDLEELKREPGLIDLGLALNKINKASPLLTIVNLPIKNDEIDNREVQFFANSIKELSNKIYFVYPDFVSQADQHLLKLPPPLENIQVIPGPTSLDKNNFAGDSVTRRTILYHENQYYLPGIISQLFNNFPSPLSYSGSFKLRQTTQVWTDFRPTGSYSHYSFMDIISDTGNLSLQNKIVIIGKDTRTNVEDYVRTPFSREVVAMTKTEALANSLDTLIQNTGVKAPPKWINTVITITVCLLTLYFVFNFVPTKGLLALLGLATLYCLVAWALFASARISITMTHPLLAIFVSYYFFIPYRLIQESRKSWEYQQKNRLLVQVEELKTNFLSMMSHDLKTPLARIQGMTDIALSHPDNLTPEQKQALNTIGSSTEELSTFISSILDLGRIESEEVKLHTQSKDINSLLEDVIKKYEFMAKAKKVEFIKEFEPLFSIKIDVELMRQVFANLIENAIKYSPENSKVLVSTEESDGKIIVQIADQGMGIPANEISNIFAKFYRSKEVKNSPIKGSGLGLFLAKYFVELHNGQISVESVPQQGSTFTVSLPMQ